MDPQTAALRSGVEILVATPGRLLDHLQQKNTSLSQVQIVVLDEADRMLDMGFLPDISRILNLLPKQRQSLMFSATFSEEIKKLAANFLHDPQLIEVARRNATADNVTQEVFKLHESEKVAALLELLSTRGPDGGRLTQVLVFVNAKIECRRLARQLQKAGINADAIHGDKTQDERMKALEGLKPMRSRCWWPPMSPRAASTSSSCRSSSITTCRSPPRITSIGSDAPVERVSAA